MKSYSKLPAFRRNITFLSSGHMTLSVKQYLQRNVNKFNVHGPLHSNNILIYIQQDATLHRLFYLQTALHVPSGTITHRQERIQLYLQHLVFITPYCYLPLSWKSWNWFECAVGGQPQHTQTSSKSSIYARLHGVKFQRTMIFKDTTLQLLYPA
jgi:hypothetical protein